jgi:hypothetical protein
MYVVDHPSFDVVHDMDLDARPVRVCTSLEGLDSLLEGICMCNELLEINQA